MTVSSTDYTEYFSIQIFNSVLFIYFNLFTEDILYAFVKSHLKVTTETDIFVGLYKSLVLSLKKRLKNKKRYKAR